MHINNEDPIVTLEELVNSYRPLSQIPGCLRSNRTVWEMEGGTVIADGLLKEARVAVCDFFISRGTTMDPHRHLSKSGEPCIEVVCLYRGSIRISNLKTGKVDKYTDRGVIIIPPGEPHELYGITDSSLICVTIPADEGYPDACIRNR